MKNEPCEHVTCAVRKNTELSAELHHAEAENIRLKSVNERLGNRLLSLSQQLIDANSEIARLGMVLRDTQAKKRLGKHSGQPHLAASLH